MKKALLGLCNNILENIDKVQLWAGTFKKYSDDEIILLAANATEYEIEFCSTKLGIKVVDTHINNITYINHERLKSSIDFLQNTDIDLFIVTDVFDVAFQANPFIKLDTEKYDIFVSGEGVLVSQEPWNSDNISRLFPNDKLKCMNTEVICSGIIAGKTKALIQLFTDMFTLCEQSLNTHNIKDQASLIVLISNNSIPNLKIFNLNDGWAMHCGVAGPTQFFEPWGFKNNIKYRIPYMHNGYIYTNETDKFDIVHQFNRTPEWHADIRSINGY